MHKSSLFLWSNVIAHRREIRHCFQQNAMHTNIKKRERERASKVNKKLLCLLWCPLPRHFTITLKKGEYITLA